MDYENNGPHDTDEYFPLMPDFGQEPEDRPESGAEFAIVLRDLNSPERS